jgi:hypothetical protein
MMMTTGDVTGDVTGRSIKTQGRTASKTRDEQIYKPTRERKIHHQDPTREGGGGGA